MIRAKGVVAGHLATVERLAASGEDSTAARAGLGLAEHGLALLHGRQRFLRSGTRRGMTIAAVPSQGPKRGPFASSLAQSRPRTSGPPTGSTFPDTLPCKGSGQLQGSAARTRPIGHIPVDAAGLNLSSGRGAEQFITGVCGNPRAVPVCRTEHRHVADRIEPEPAGMLRATMSPQLERLR